MRTAILVFLTAAVTFVFSQFYSEIIFLFAPVALRWSIGIFVACALVFAALVLFGPRVFTTPKSWSDVWLSISDVVRTIGDALPKSIADQARPQIVEQSLEVFKTIAAVLAWGYAKWGILTVMLSLLAAIVAFAGSTIAIRQNQLVEKQNGLVEIEVKNAQNQTELLTAQNNLVSIQNSIAEQEKDLSAAEKGLLEAEGRLQVQQIKLTEDQLAMVQKQLLLMEQQNALTQATRQASFSSELSAIQDQIAIEMRAVGDFPPDVALNPPIELPLKASWVLSDEATTRIRDQLGYQDRAIKIVARGESADVAMANPFDLRVAMPESLVLRIVNFSSNLEAYPVRLPDGEMLFLSPERAQLFETMRTSRIWLYPITTNLNLSHADFRGRKLSNADFLGTNLMNATFDKGELMNCAFGSQNLETTSFRSVRFIFTNFESAQLPPVANLSGSEGIRPEDLIGAFSSDKNWLEDAVRTGILKSNSFTDDDGKLLDSICLVEYKAGISGINPVHPALSVQSGWSSSGYRICLTSLSGQPINSDGYFENESRRIAELTSISISSLRKD